MLKRIYIGFLALTFLGCGGKLSDFVAPVSDVNASLPPNLVGRKYINASGTQLANIAQVVGHVLHVRPDAEGECTEVSAGVVGLDDYLADGVDVDTSAQDTLFMDTRLTLRGAASAEVGQMLNIQINANSAINVAMADILIAYETDMDNYDRERLLAWASAENRPGTCAEYLITGGTLTSIVHTTATQIDAKTKVNASVVAIGAEFYQEGNDSRLTLLVSLDLIPKEMISPEGEVQLEVSSEMVFVAGGQPQSRPRLGVPHGDLPFATLMTVTVDDGD